jgi:7-keto-8-aminopelargonate synthetase-like enzyme
VFTTGLPPVVPGAALAALEIIRGGDGDERRRRLAANARAMRQRLGLGDGSSPIVPIVLGGDARTMAVSRALFEARVFVQGIRPPTVPEGTARLRVSVAAGHTIEEIGQAAEIIDDAVRCST